MLEDFKKFAFKGNVLDLAVGVIIGAAFGKIVTSLVNDIVMPLLGIVLGNINLTNLFITLGAGSFNTIEEAKAANVPTLNYGIFLNNVIDFLIVALAIYIVVEKTIKAIKKKEKKEELEAVIELKKKCPYCYNELHIDATRCGFCTSKLK